VVADGNLNLEAVDELLISAGEIVTQSKNWVKGDRFI
jgi:hypothetical protein